VGKANGLRARAPDDRLRVRTILIEPQDAWWARRKRAFAHPTDLNLNSSSPAKAGDPARCGYSIQSLTSLEYWIIRPSAQLRTRRMMTVRRWSRLQ
jgi:hypothetical protein